MFEPGYLSALIDQGYKDAQSHKEEVINAINNKKLSSRGGQSSRAFFCARVEHYIYNNQ